MLVAALRGAQRRIATAAADDVARATCLAAVDVLAASGAIVHAPDGDDLVVRAVVGGHGATVGSRLPREGSLAGRVLATGRGETCRDALADDRTDAVRNARIGVRSSVLVPLRGATGEVVAVLAAVSASEAAFGDTDLDLLALVADLAGARLTHALAVAQGQRTLDRLAESEEDFRAAFDHAPTGMTMLGLTGASRGRLVRVNTAMCRLLGRSTEELVGTTLPDWTHTDDVAADEARLERLLAGHERVISYDKRYRHSSGRTVRCWVTSAVVSDDAGRPLHLVSHAIDVTARLEAEGELHRLAHSDVLTGLANRALLSERIAAGLQQRRGDADRLALLLLDLDRFKLVNDTLGHHVGDELLVEVAARLLSVARGGSTVARLGGDEFVLLVEQVTGADDALAVAARVAAALREPVVLGSGDTVTCTSSIGIALSEPGLSAEDLYRHADLALYRAKDAGRDRAALFDDELRARAVSRLDREGRLRRALTDGSLRVEHQPLVDVLTGLVVGHEALVRFPDPEGALTLPTDVIEVAEGTGLVTTLDAQLLERAVADLAGTSTGLLAVNVSGRSLADGGYAARVAEVTRRYGVDPARLLVEVTEHSLLEVRSAVTDSLAELAALGVRTGIDDFGTGYSALAYLRRFRLDFLKIDRSFVTRLGRSARDDAVVRAIVDLAHAHDLTVTAEGVETPLQLDRLRAMGCDRVQGYLMGRPSSLLGPVGPGSERGVAERVQPTG